MSEAAFPHVRFEYVAVEDRQGTIEKGYYVSKDVVYAHMTRPGQRDTLVKDANQHFLDLKNAAQQGRIPQTWAGHYKELLDAWKNDTELPLVGTPIKGWSALPSSAQRELLHAGIRTVQDLAALPEADMTSIGMGAIGYRQKAIAWLKTAEQGKAAEQMAALSQRLEEATRIIAEQAAALALISAAPRTAGEALRQQAKA